MEIKKTTNRICILICIFSVISFFILLFAITLSNTVPINDDFWFAEKTRNLSIYEWVFYRWDVWSSRVLPESFLWIFAPESRAYWIAASCIVYLSYIFIFYKYIQLFRATDNNKEKILYILLSCVSIFLLSNSVFSESVLWLTGSVNYFWIGTIFLFALYMPLHIAIKGHLPNIAFQILSWVSMFAVSISHEQFGVSISILSSAITIYYITNNDTKLRKVFNNKYVLTLTIFSFISIVFLIVALKAPGNAIRSSEEIRWLPDLYSVDLFTRMESSIRFFLDRLINNSGVILSAIWITLAITTFKKNRYMFTFFSTVAILAIINIIRFNSNIAISELLSIKPISYIYEFHATWGFSGGLIQWLPVLFWSASILITLLSLCRYTDKTTRLLTVSLFIVACVTLAALWLSPTMYASSYRVVYASSLLLSILSIVLIVNIKKYSK